MEHGGKLVKGRDPEVFQRKIARNLPRSISLEMGAPIHLKLICERPIMHMSINGTKTLAAIIIEAFPNKSTTSTCHILA